MRCRLEAGWYVWHTEAIPVPQERSWPSKGEFPAVGKQRGDGNTKGRRHSQDDSVGVPRTEAPSGHGRGATAASMVTARLDRCIRMCRTVVVVVVSEASVC